VAVGRDNLYQQPVPTTCTNNLYQQPVPRKLMWLSFIGSVYMPFS